MSTEIMEILNLVDKVYGSCPLNFRKLIIGGRADITLSTKVLEN